MCIRTVAEKLQADRKKKDKTEEEGVNEELNLAINALGGDVSDEERIEIIDYIEELRDKKASLVEKKGERLAEKLGTKWYNEGEKSTRYFLNLLNRRAPDSFQRLSSDSGEEIEKPEEIEKEIVKFYKSLYENYDKSKVEEVSINDEFFAQLSSVTDADDDAVSAQVTLKELEDTLLTCKNSAPGPDGIPYSYYRNLWRLVGPLILEAWKHTLVTGKLCPSHRVSFLKLIPKVGKDLKKLTNWRPITLSNCDHKIITKLYAKRMSSVIAKHIGERQTAYLKGRLINDNIRAILTSINLTNNEENLDGLIVSLDAKKAFDSVEHSYIIKCLDRFGLKKFVPVFQTLYSELRSDIIINGRIAEGFKILRGVKQGDALSCVLFIMCMEPLLRNIEVNPLIECLVSRELGPLPKAYAYADDVNSIITNNPVAVQELFIEYGRLTAASGLELNADKTEIMRLNSRHQNKVTFNINYANSRHRIESQMEVKINGILFQQNEDRMRDANVDAALKKIDAQLKRWSARHLSVLGKICIVKTFGISQVTFLMQSMVLNVSHFKKFNNLLYKFIWNRHYLAAKAPERIKRDIVNTPLKQCGLGMLDLSELDKSLKLRAVARLLESKHPFLEKVLEKVDLADHFFPKSKFALERLSYEGIRLLKELRQNLIGDDRLQSNRTYVAFLRNSKIENAVSRIGKNSIAYFNVRRQGHTKFGELSTSLLNSLKPFIDRNFFTELKKAILINIDHQPVQNWPLPFYKGNKFVSMSKLTSKEIRQELATVDPICVFKFGAICSPGLSINWGFNLARISSVRHKSCLLRIAHGEVYTKEKLHRFGLNDNPNCPRCGLIEDLEHKFITCHYIKLIWQEAFKLLSKLTDINPNEYQPNLILGMIKGTEPLLLSVLAEILQRIMYLKDNHQYLVRPKVIVTRAIELVARREIKQEDKNRLSCILSD